MHRRNQSIDTQINLVYRDDNQLNTVIAEHNLLSASRKQSLMYDI